MDNNNDNLYSYSSSVSEDFQKAQAMAATIRYDEHLRDDKRLNNSVIFGIIASLTGIVWLIMMVIYYLIIIIGRVFGETDFDGLSGFWLVSPIILIPVWGISFVCALIAIFNKVNIISGIGFYSATHLLVAVIAVILCAIFGGNIICFAVILLMLFLLIFLFLRWLKRKQEF